MNRQYLKYFGALLITLVSVCFAQINNNLTKRIQQKFNSMEDITITFTQHNLPNRPSSKTFGGTILVKKGNKFKLELEGQTIVSNGKIVWSYSKATKQVLIDNFQEDTQGASIDKMLASLNGGYECDSIGKEKLGDSELAIVKMLPKNDTLPIKYMQIWIDERDLLIRKMQVVDLNEYSTTYTIDKMKFNSHISDRVFQFEPPKGVEIVDMR